MTVAMGKPIHAVTIYDKCRDGRVVDCGGLENR